MGIHGLTLFCERNKDEISKKVNLSFLARQRVVRGEGELVLLLDGAGILIVGFVPSMRLWETLSTLPPA